MFLSKPLPLLMLILREHIQSTVKVRWKVCFLSVPFSSVVQSCPTLCNPMDCNTQGLPVHQKLPEFTQTHVHWVGDAIHPSHPSPFSSCLLSFSYCSWGSQDKNAEAVCHSLLWEHWSGLPCPSPGDLLNPGIEPKSLALQADSLLSEPPGKPTNTGVGSLCLLQRLFLTQESNQGLLHCRQTLYQLSYQLVSSKHKTLLCIKVFWTAK